MEIEALLTSAVKLISFLNSINDAINVISGAYKITNVKRFDFHHTKDISHCKSARSDEFRIIF